MKTKVHVSLMSRCFNGWTEIVGVDVDAVICCELATLHICVQS